MNLDGSEVVHFLNGPETVRDGTLVSISIQDIDETPIIELVFKRRFDPCPRVKLELGGVKEFDYRYTADNRPFGIEFVKCLMTEDGDFYISLDPYDEHEAFISEKDNDFFRSKFVRLVIGDFPRAKS